MNHKYLESCLCCGSHKLRTVLDLGDQPLANSYSTTPDAVLPTYPLQINVCAHCWNAQQAFCVDRAEIFSNYAYVSGTSGTLQRYFEWFAQRLAAALPAGAAMLEIAANDGSFLKRAQAHGLACLGIDPAQNIVEGAQAAGLPILCGFWPGAAEDIAERFDAIVCMNVVAHVDDPLSFVRAGRDRLKPGGVILIQPSQARIFGNGEFDTCYHEHVSFFNTRSIAALAEKLGLALYGTALVNIHGDSPLFILGHRDAPPHAALLTTFHEGEFAINEALEEYDARIRLFDWSTYEAFAQKTRAVLDNLTQLVQAYRDKGYEIVCVGAAAKAMTVINASGIRPDRFLDESPLKIGTYAPGSGAPVDSLARCADIGRPALFVVTAWNFREELVAKMKRFGAPADSVFYSYFPTPNFIE